MLRRVPGFGFVLFAVLFSLANGNAVAQSSPETTAVPGELLVKFKRDASPALRQEVLKRRGAEVIHHFAALDIDHIRLTSAKGARANAAEFAAEQDVVYSQPNY